MQIYNKTDKGVDINIDDEIGFWGVDQNTVKFYLREAGGADINLNVSSLGGDVIHAFAIFNMLKSYEGKVTANIYGDAASAATLIALAADTVNISKNVFFMIHNVSGGAVGSSEDLRKTADRMDKYNENIVDLYANKTGLNKSEIRNMMDNETWFTAKEAKDSGFVDEVTESSEILNNSRTEQFLNNVLNKESASILLNKINTNKKQMELNEQSIVDKVTEAIKNLLPKKEAKKVEKPAEPVIENAKPEVDVEAIVAKAIGDYALENKGVVDGLQAKLDANKVEIENAATKLKEANEAIANAEAGKTVGDLDEGQESPDRIEELAYTGNVKNLVKKIFASR